MVIANADRIILATGSRTVPHQRQTGEPIDRIRVPVGHAEVAVEGPVALWVIRISLKHLIEMIRQSPGRVLFWKCRPLDDQLEQLIRI